MPPRFLLLVWQVCGRHRAFYLYLCVYNSGVYRCYSRSVPIAV